MVKGLHMSIEQIISKFRKELFGYVRKYIKDEDAAKDVHQEILIKIFTHYQSLKNRERLKPWIYRIARNSITDHFRRNKTFFSDLPENIGDYEIPKTSEDELIPCIKPFLKQLKPSYQEALAFTDLGNNTQKELAEKLNISYSGAKSRVQRARLQLRTLFEQCCQIEADKYGSILSVTQKSGCACH